MANKFLLRTNKYQQRCNRPSTHPIFFSHDLFRNGLSFSGTAAQKISLKTLDLSCLPVIAFYSFSNVHFSPNFVSFVCSLPSGPLSAKGVREIRLVSGPSLRGALRSDISPISLFDGHSYFLVHFSSWSSAISFFKATTRSLFRLTDILEEDQKEKYQVLNEVFSHPAFCVMNGTILDVEFMRRYYSYPLINPVREELLLSFPFSTKFGFSSFGQMLLLLSRVFVVPRYLAKVFQTFFLIQFRVPLF
jgi:hypothetical protein